MNNHPLCIDVPANTAPPFSVLIGLWWGCSLWKHEAGVYHDVAVPDADQHAVHADLAQAANWQNAQWRSLARWRPRELPG
jgi:hypothetical protein